MSDPQQANRAERALRAFVGTPLDGLLEHTGDPSAVALALFHDAAAAVPAYCTFLRAHDCDPAAIRTPADFARVPLVTKVGYLRKHALPSLCRGGRLDGCGMTELALAEDVGSHATRFRMLKLFDGHDALHTILRREGKSTWALHLNSPA